MNIAAILELVSEVVGLAPKLAALGVDVADLIGKARAALVAVNAPTDVDWQALDQMVADLEKQLNTDPPAP